MSAARFEIGDKVWHPANKDNGITEGVAIVIARQNKESHSAGQYGFSYKLQDESSLQGLGFMFDEKDLKTLAEFEQYEEERKKAKEEAAKQKKEAENQRSSNQGASNTVLLQTKPDGSPLENPNLSGGPIATQSGTVLREVPRDQAPPPGVAGSPVPPPKTTDEQKKADEEKAKKDQEEQKKNSEAAVANTPAATGTTAKPGTPPAPGATPPRTTTGS